MDTSNSVNTTGAVYPVHAIDSQAWSRTEPVITPDQLRRRHLWGIPLYSFFVNPVTKKRDELTDTDLQDHILRAVADIELESGLTIFPVQYDEKYEYSPTFWENWGYVQVSRRPIMTVDKVALTPPSNDDIIVLDPAWIEPANFHKGQINICPIIPAIGSAQFQTATGTGGASAYVIYYFGRQWVPAFLRVTYTCGFPNGQVPRMINEVVGIQAAINVLGMLGTTNTNNSYSINIDGTGQSVSNGGPQIYAPRIQQLETQKKQLLGKLKNTYGLGIHSSFV